MTVIKPLMPACFLHWTEAGGEGGEDTLRLMTWRRTLTLRGSAFRTFEERVLPLLDGTRQVDDICAAVADVFDAQDVIQSLDMLTAQGVVVEGATDIAQDLPDTLAPQLGWLGENAPEGRAAQGRVQAAHVVLFGAGTCGAAVARSLVASGIGSLTIVDPADVTQADGYFSALFTAKTIGTNRADTLRDALAASQSSCTVTAHTARPNNADEITQIISGASLVLCCLDSGELNLALLLNQACYATGTPWISASMQGTELLIGPGFFQTGQGPCYQCWRMREMAAAPNQATHYATEVELARRQTDLSPHRENLAASADIVGGMLAAEALTWLSGTSPPNLDGRFMTMTLPGLHTQKHQVLRKPGCPVCTPT